MGRRSVALCLLQIGLAVAQAQGATTVPAAGSVPGVAACAGGARALADRIGCAHVSGRYNFTSEDFLNEGADRILASGMRVIKVYLHDPHRHYPFNSLWPEFHSMAEMAAHPYFRKLFAKPFSTYILTTYAINQGKPVTWKDGLSEDEYTCVEREFYALTDYLLRTYRGTGKTFVLQHWEGDWAVRNSTSTDPKDDPSDAAIEGMIRWLNARQEGVSRARKDFPNTDVRVYHACEVNLVSIAMHGRRTVTNDVVPHTHCDLYSYSAYDTIGLASSDPAAGRDLFRRAIDYLASKAPDSPAFGDKNVYIGEFGWPEVASEQDPDVNTDKSLQVIRMTVETALDRGCPYVVYWQVYDNESRAGNRRPNNAEVRGFYLIKPDGTPAPAWHYFLELLRPPSAMPSGPRSPRTESAPAP